MNVCQLNDYTIFLYIAPTKNLKLTFIHLCFVHTIYLYSEVIAHTYMTTSET